MAIAFVKNGGVASNKAGGNTTLALTVPAGGHAAGDTLVVFAAWMTSSARTGTISDSRGNTYTEIEPGVPGAGSFQVAPIFASVLNTALQAGDTVTLTISSGTYLRSALSSIEFSGLTVIEDVASANGSGTVGQPTVGPITPPSAATLVLSTVLLGGPTGDTFTQDTDVAGGPGWSAGPLSGTTGGSATTNITLRSAYKITTASAAQTYNPTVGTVRGWAASLAALQPAPFISQAQYRWRNDDGNETTATWVQAVNTAYGVLDDAIRKRLRVTIDETVGVNPPTTVWKLQCRIGSGTWQDVNASGTICRPSASSNLADDATTTQQLSSGLGTFVGGRFDEVDGAQSTVDLAAGGVTEHEFSIALYGNGEAINPGDTINFRVVKSDNSLLNTYAVTPSLTVGAVPRKAQVTWVELEVPEAAGAVDYTDSGTALLKFTVSATEEHTTFDTGTAALVLTPSGTDVYGRETIDADTAALRFTPSATEERQQYDVGTANLRFTPSATEEHTTYDVDTVPLRLTPSASEEKQQYDAATTLLALTPSGTEFQGRETIDAATAQVVFTPNAAETAQFADAVTVPLRLLPSAAEERQIYDAATALLKLTASGADTAQYVDSATTLLALIPSGTEEKQQYDTATVLLALGPSSTDIAQYIDTNTTLFKLTPSGTDEYTPLEGVTYTDSATADLRFAPSGTDERTQFDAAIAQLLFTPSGAEERQMYDAATASLTLSPSGTEEHTTFDSASVRLSFTPSGIDERSYFDVATANLRFNPSSTDTAQFVDVNTALLALLPSGTESISGTTEDAATVPLLLVPTATDVAALLDATTVPLALQPSGQDLPVYVDSATTTLLFTPSGVDTLTSGYSDSATIPLNLRPSAVDILVGVDTATPVVVLTPSGVEGFGGNVDEGLIYLKLTPGTLAEVLYLFDTLLTATLSTRFAATIQQSWEASVLQQWSASMHPRLWAASLGERVWAATLNRRWNDTFAGTGPGKLIFYAFDFLLAGTLKNRWSGTAEQSWSATMVSRWSAIVLNRSWSGQLANRTWVADLVRRWNPKYIGRGKD